MKTNINAKNSTRARPLTCAWSRFARLALGLPLFALPVPAQEPASTSAETDGDVVILSPFNVTTTRDYGYRASNSIAGTRSNTPIKEVPLNIQVFTKDLADDMLLTNQIDLERYNAALVNGGADVHSSNAIQQAYNNFLFRGFVQNWGLRDGNRELDPIDTQGVARVELVKGPCAALYGVAYPGGVMNIISKAVDFDRNFTATRFSLQSEGEYRATLDANYTGKVGERGKVGLRVNAVNAQTEDHRAHSSGEVEYLQTALAWRPFAATEIKFLAEEGYREKPNGLGYFSRDDGNGLETPLQIVHPEIPWSWNWGDEINMRSAEHNLYRAAINQSFGEDLSFTAYFQSSVRDQIDSDGWDAAGNGGSAASWDMTFSSRGVPQTGWLEELGVIRKAYHYRNWRNAMHAYGATALYRFETGDIDHVLTVGANAWKEKFSSIKGIQPGGSLNVVDFPISPAADTKRVPRSPPPDYFIDAGAQPGEDNSNDYYYVSWQVAALENRLRGTVAVNRTNLKLVQFANVVRETEASKNSPMYGAMYDVTKDVSLFAVHSTSLFPTTDKNDFDVQMPPVVGTSNEVGFKVELLDGKVSGTISYYQITQEGGSQRDPNAVNRAKLEWDAMTVEQRVARWGERARTDPTGTRASLHDRLDQEGDLVPGGEQESKGFEADLIIQPTPQWQLLLSYAHNNQEVTKAINTATIGLSTNGQIKDQFSFLTKYTLADGSMKGLSLGLGGQYAGKALQGYISGDIARYNPSTFYLEAFAGYRFKVLDYDASVQLNLKNLTEQDEFTGWRADDAGLGTVRYEVPTKMRYALTFGLDF